ncbi:carbohydrate binding domain-containing protein, partial [Paenibacillus sp. 598K]|uniref:carbohydrate binding domain-containing protein n=1 Tax=Paenibacillus sp. 598K TaxID=1117987 RepID=UPI001623B057
TVNAQYAGAIVDMLGKMEQNNQYEMSAKVRMAEGQSPTVLRISVQNGEGSYANVSQNATVNADGWVELKGTYIQSMESTLLKAYIEVANTYAEPRTFYLDDFKLSYVGPVAGPLPVQTDIGKLSEIYKNDFLIGNAGGTVTLQGNNL